MARTHLYNLTVRWTGNKGTGTSDYRAYDRSHTIKVTNKPELLGSSDKAFRGDSTRHNPEDLLIASVSSCHMLWYLHLCADAGITVIDYEDLADGILEENGDGGGQFKLINLNPYISITENSDLNMAIQLHKRANELCFIARSLNFPIHHHPVIIYST